MDDEEMLQGLKKIPRKVELKTQRTNLGLKTTKTDSKDYRQPTNFTRLDNLKKGCLEDNRNEQILEQENTLSHKLRTNGHKG